MSTRPTITVVIPVHNEADYLPEAVPLLFAELEAVPADVSVRLMENGSTDATVAVGERLAENHAGLSVTSLDAPDYGGAMRAGFLGSDSEWVANFDIDYFSGEFLRDALAQGADVVLASKRARGSEDRRSLLRRAGTLVFNLILRVLFRSSVSDTHGMKLIRRSVIDSVGGDVVSTLDLFDTELVLRAERAGFTIAELPVLVEERREARSSLLSRVPRTLKGLWRIRRQFASEGR